jgi:hypothetical protein
MEKILSEKTGIQVLVEKYREMFRIPENLNYYSEEDYQAAERKFLKYALFSGKSKMH